MYGLMIDYDNKSIFYGSSTLCAALSYTADAVSDHLEMYFFSNLASLFSWLPHYTEHLSFSVFHVDETEWVLNIIEETTLC